jgi:hypothetical protein
LRRRGGVFDGYGSPRHQCDLRAFAARRAAILASAPAQPASNARPGSSMSTTSGA